MNLNPGGEDLYILGSGATTLEILDAAMAQVSWRKIFRIDPDGVCLTPDALSPEEALRQCRKTAGAYLFGMTSRGYRDGWSEWISQAGIRAATICHPRAVVSPSATIGGGSYIAAGAILSAQVVLGQHTFVNFNTVLGHGVETGDHCIFSPGVTVGGNVQLGSHVFVGANAFIHQGKKVGTGSRIDALSFVDRDIGEHMLATSRKALKTFPLNSPEST